MAIYIIKAKEISEVTFKVEADSLTGAYKSINKWIEDPKNHDRLKYTKDCSLINYKEYINKFNNEDEYNRYCDEHIDYEIAGDKIELEEPIYILEFIHEDGSKIIYDEMNMNSVISKIRMVNINHILKPAIPSNAAYGKQAIVRKKYANTENIFVLSYRLKDRSK